MKHKIFLVLLALLVFVSQRHSVSSLGLADSPWPMFHGNPQHTGLSPYDTSHVDGTVKWSFETGDGIESSPAIGSDGTIYVGSNSGNFYAINPDGTEKWHFDSNGGSFQSSPAIGSEGS